MTTKQKIEKLLIIYGEVDRYERDIVKLGLEHDRVDRTLFHLSKARRLISKEVGRLTMMSYCEENQQND